MVKKLITVHNKNLLLNWCTVAYFRITVIKLIAKHGFPFWVLSYEWITNFLILITKTLDYGHMFNWNKRKAQLWHWRPQFWTINIEYLLSISTVYEHSPEKAQDTRYPRGSYSDTRVHNLSDSRRSAPPSDMRTCSVRLLM